MSDELQPNLYRATATIDIIRDIVRHLIGAGTVFGTFVLCYSFVAMAPTDAKVDLIRMILIFIFGFTTGVGTWYFPGGMRSALKGADIAKKEAEAKYATAVKPDPNGNGSDAAGPTSPAG